MPLLSICNILGYTCLFLAWLVPDHIPPWNTFPQESLTILGVSLLWPWQRLRAWPVRLCFMALLWIGIAGFQHALHLIDLGDLLWASLLAVFFMMAASTGAQAVLAIQSPDTGPTLASLQGWCLVLVAAALANAVIGLAQWQGVTQGLFMHGSTGRVYGNLAQPNQFATLMVLALGALVCLDDQTRLRGGWPHIAALLLVFALAASESRTGALAITLLVLAVAVGGGTARASLRWLVPALLLFWLFYIGWQPISHWLGGSVSRSNVGLNSSTRFELWQQMLEAIALRPWLGYGWLNVGQAQQAVAHYLGGTVNMDHAHNLFFDMLVWFGLPIGGFLVVASIAWGFQSMRAAFKRHTPQAHTAFLCLLMLLPIAVHSMLEYPFAYMYFALVFAFFAGALETALGYTRPLETRGRHMASACALVGVLCATWMGAEYIQIEKDFRALRLEREFVTPPNAQHHYAPPPVLLTQFGTLIAALRVQTQAPVDAPTLETVRRAAARFPWLLTLEQYYLVLLANNLCEDATRQRLVLQSLFGKFGIAKVDEAIQLRGINTRCNQ